MDALPLLFAFALVVAVVGVVVWAIARSDGIDPDTLIGRQALDTGPGEPCWSEEIRREGPLSLGRGQCVNEALLELDKRAARGDFPVPNMSVSGANG